MAQLKNINISTEVITEDDIKENKIQVQNVNSSWTNALFKFVKDGTEYTINGPLYLDDIILKNKVVFKGNYTLGNYKTTASETKEISAGTSLAAMFTTLFEQ